MSDPKKIKRIIENPNDKMIKKSRRLSEQDCADAFPPIVGEPENKARLDSYGAEFSLVKSLFERRAVCGLAVEDNYAFMSIFRTKLVKINTSNGKEIWERRHDARQCDRIMLTSALVILRAVEEFAAFNKSDGLVIWRVNTLIGRSFFIHEGAIITSGNTAMMRIRYHAEKTMQEKWVYPPLPRFSYRETFVWNGELHVIVKNMLYLIDDSKVKDMNPWPYKVCYRATLTQIFESYGAQILTVRSTKDRLYIVYSDQGIFGHQIQVLNLEMQIVINVQIPISAGLISHNVFDMLVHDGFVTIVTNNSIMLTTSDLKLLCKMNYNKSRDNPVVLPVCEGKIAVTWLSSTIEEWLGNRIDLWETKNFWSPSKHTYFSGPVKKMVKDVVMLAWDRKTELNKLPRELLYIILMFVVGK